MVSQRGSDLHSDNSTPIVPGPLCLSDGRKVAYLDPKGTISKSIKRNHFLGTPPGIAFDRDVWNTAKERGARQVAVKAEDGREFTCSVETFDRYHNTPFNRGFGWQLVLCLSYWSINGNLSEHERNEQRRKNDNSQLGLFGGAA